MCGFVRTLRFVRMFVSLCRVRACARRCSSESSVVTVGELFVWLVAAWMIWPFSPTKAARMVIFYLKPRVCPVTVTW